MKIKKNELKQYGKEDLNKKLNELKKELLKLNGQTGSGAPLQSPGMMKSVKRNIARIHTYLKQKKEGKNK